MRIGYEMSLKQVQKLVITPELRQAITILQLPWMELEQYISEEMLENPLLEFKEKCDDKVRIRLIPKRRMSCPRKNLRKRRIMI